MKPALNWREIESLAVSISKRLQGARIERVQVPARPEFPEGYLKAEVALRVSNRLGDGSLVLSTRPEAAFFYYEDGKTRGAAAQATRSPFDLLLHKLASGSKVLAFQAIPRERGVILWFDSSDTLFGLLLWLIPAKPEMLLVKAPVNWEPNRDPLPKELELVARSLGNTESGTGKYEIPNGEHSPETAEVRKEILENPDQFSSFIESDLARIAFERRRDRALREMRKAKKSLEKRLSDADEAKVRAESESPWKLFADTLTAKLYENPLAKNGVYIFVDMQIPADVKRSASEQAAHFYSLDKRKRRRISEALDRIQETKEKITRLDHLERQIKTAVNLQELVQIEETLGLTNTSTTAKSSTPFANWSGKRFQSLDGNLILIGRNKTENQELTFKIAKGADIWLHVRGKPGAHALIPLPSGKSASLETLLDAAALVIHYSGGANWGKTEVDYTKKKYIKRIRDSAQVSYTHEKTLVIAPEEKRLKRLLSKEIL